MATAQTKRKEESSARIADQQRGAEFWRQATEVGKKLQPEPKQKSHEDERQQ